MTTDLDLDADADADAELASAAAAILAAQGANGMISWFPGGHGDPWNHVEAAMALAATGELTAAARAYDWLARTQRADGSWHTYYRPDGTVEEPRVDTNVTAYVATGVYHQYLAGRDASFAAAFFPVVARALDFVLRYQRPGGEIAWAVGPDGTGAPFALLAGSCAVHLSLCAGADLAAALGAPRPDWAHGAARLAEAIANRPALFADKSVFAMDWYYPVLAGVLSGPAATDRLARGTAAFVVPGAGVRCRSDRRWVTTAESAECALAHLRAGDEARAVELLATTFDKRASAGGYLTGLVYPERSTFPPGEVSTYSAAAVLLARGALRREHATTTLFAPDRLSAPS